MRHARKFLLQSGVSKYEKPASSGRRVTEYTQEQIKNIQRHIASVLDYCSISPDFQGFSKPKYNEIFSEVLESLVCSWQCKLYENENTEAVIQVRMIINFKRINAKSIIGSFRGKLITFDPDNLYSALQELQKNKGLMRCIWDPQQPQNFLRLNDPVFGQRRGNREVVVANLDYYQN